MMAPNTASWLKTKQNKTKKVNENSHGTSFHIVLLVTISYYSYHDNDNDNESNSIAMNYIDHIIGDVQASSWKRNELVFVYIHLHSGIVSTLFSRISMYDTKKQNHNALFKPNNAVSKFMTKGARSLGLWTPISVEMKQNIRRGAEEQENCASAKCGLYCRYSEISIHLLLTALFSFCIRSVHQ